MQALLGEVANKGGMSDEEIDANQMQVDSIINSIDRIANSTEFEGIKLLNGNEAYTETHTAADIAELTINAAKLIDGATMTVAIDQSAEAERGEITLDGAIAGGQITIQLSSNRGTTELTFADGTAVVDMETAINAVSEITGVVATQGGGVLNSVDYGTDAYVTLEVTDDQSGGDLTDQTDAGVNAVATINGIAATGDGKVLKLRTSMLDIEVDLATAFTGANTTTISITGGGADFALGAMVDAIGLESVGIPNIASGQLGNDTDGRLSTLKSGGTNALTSDNLYTAQNILSETITDISKLRGRLGSFQKNTLATTINSLKITGENLMAADSAIRDTDFAAETSNLTRGQILVQAATAVLAQANAAPQAVLQLL